MLRICSKKAIRSKALTLSVYLNVSTWANLGNCYFIDREKQKQELPDYKLYRHIKTAVSSGGMIFAKKNESDTSIQAHRETA